MSMAGDWQRDWAAINAWAKQLVRRHTRNPRSLDPENIMHTTKRMLQATINHVIDDIPPLSIDTPFSPRHVPPAEDFPVNIPLAEYLTYLATIPRAGHRAEFLADPPMLRDALETPEARERVLNFEQAGQVVDEADVLLFLNDIERLEPGNPAVHYARYTTLCNSPRQDTVTLAYQYFQAVKKAADLAGTRGRYWYYRGLIGALAALGRYHAAYLLGLTLIVIDPLNSFPYIQGAYPAFQLLRPFQWLLKTAVLIDLDSVLRVLGPAWRVERIQPYDSLEDYGLALKDLEEWERQAKDCSMQIMRRRDNARGYHG